MAQNIVNKDIETNTNSINDLNNTVKTLLDHIYPIGSIYMNVDSIDPNTILGGTWERIYNKFLLGGGDSYKVGSTGGEANHTLTIAEMPSHNHSFNKFNGYSNPQFFNADSSGGNWTYDNQFMIAAKRKIYNTDFPDTITEKNLLVVPIANTGSSQPHNNMPPYLSICIWKRIA